MGGAASKQPSKRASSIVIDNSIDGKPLLWAEDMRLEGNALFTGFAAKASRLVATKVSRCTVYSFTNTGEQWQICTIRWSFLWRAHVSLRVCAGELISRCFVKADFFSYCWLRATIVLCGDVHTRVRSVMQQRGAAPLCVCVCVCAGMLPSVHGCECMHVSMYVCVHVRVCMCV